jgi:hypothetical protein
VNPSILGHTVRTGRCICGCSLAAHFDRRNAFISCEELAEREAAIAAATCCTTRLTAEQLVRGRHLLREGRF